MSRPISAQSIQDRYAALYGSGALSLSQNYSDKYPLLEHLLKDEVRDKRVLDFGCGPGRLALMLARYATHVHGVDYAGEGIALASVLARAAGADNVAFGVGDLPWVLAQGRRYDVVVLAGVLEHLEEPVAALAALEGAVAPGGLLCVQCPSFANFRGDVYNTLGHLLGLPMTLTDRWQITPEMMMFAQPEINFWLDRVVGGHYHLAFLERILEDFRKRLPNAARDADLGAAWHWERFFEWIEQRVEQNRRLLIDTWVSRGALTPVPKCPPLPARRPEGVGDGLWAELEHYLTYDGWREPWYSDVAPVCYYGASAVYFFRKLR